MAKPFIAARIPQIVEDRLNERSQESGLGKTEIIVNALAEYLGCVIDAPQETHAIDRLIAVEEELREIKSRLEVLEKPIKEAPIPQIPGQGIIPFDAYKSDNVSDKQSEIKLTEMIATRPEESQNDNKSDNEYVNLVSFPSDEAAKLLGVSRPTLDYQVKNNKLPFTKNGYTLIGKIGDGKSASGKNCILWEVQKTDATTN
jgi:hypothetical protein